MPRSSVTVEPKTFQKQETAQGARVKKIHTAAPVLAALELGEFAMGNAAQGANLRTIYFKVNSTMVIALNVNSATNAVTASVIT